MTALRVLLVEDSEDDALLVAGTLERELRALSWQRVDSPDGFSAALQGGVWDVIISDHRMPAFNSTQALSLLKQTGMDIPFIIVSGSIGEEVAVAAMKAGASDYFLKGDLSRLAPAIEREVREARNRRALRGADEALRALEMENGRVLEAVRAKGHLLAAVSHDLRTPLTAIIGFTHLLDSGDAGPLTGEQREYLGDIRACSDQLLQIINDLLDSAKAEAGKLNLLCEPCDLRPIIEEVLSTLRPLSSARDIGLRFESAAFGERAVVDRARFKQVLYNFVSNAIKFSPVGGSVTVTCAVSADGRFVRTSVTDSGEGIAAEDLKRLFVPFTQLENARHVGGSGLGLSLVKQLAELMGGTVGVASTPGRGSTFHVELPSHRPSENARAQL
jgi:signal transduction histidine kinase